MVLIDRALVPRLRVALADPAHADLVAVAAEVIVAIDDYPSRVIAEAGRAIRDVARGVVEAERWRDDTERAAEAARSARFEHGESPS